MGRRAKSHERDRQEKKDWIGRKMGRRAKSHERDRRKERLDRTKDGEKG